MGKAAERVTLNPETAGGKQMTDAGKQARREYKKAWNRANAERVNAYQRNWRKANPEKVKNYQDNYWNKKGQEAST